MSWDSDIPEKMSDALFDQEYDQFIQLYKNNPDLHFDEIDGEEAWLKDATSLNALPIVKFLIDEQGVDVNGGMPEESSDTPIFIPCAKGHFDVVKFLIERGARLNVKRGDQLVCFPLLNAAIHGHLDIIKLLLDHGANLDFVWRGNNVLMEAKAYGQKEAAEYLASLGLKDLRETTPPDYPASYQKMIEIMTEQRGASGSWEYIIPGEPEVTLHVAGPEEEFNCLTVFTTGLSDEVIHTSGGKPITTELEMRLPPGWPIEDAAPDNSETGWPIYWLTKIIRQTLSTKTWPDAHAALFSNDEGSLGLGPGTNLSDWIAVRGESMTCQMPDYRYVQFRLIFPIYAEERDILEQQGADELLRRFYEKDVVMTVSPDRINVGNR